MARKPVTPEIVHPGPDLEPIRRIHRGGDGWVRFTSRSEGGSLLPIAHLRVDSLEQMFPEWREELIRDAYFSVNSFWRPGTARTADLRYLNVCYSDLDYYKAETDRAAALAAIVRAQDADLIPAASILADSGCGLYAFWLLVSPTEPGRPERYYRHHPEKLERYRRVQMALHKALKKLEPALEPDPNAIDASRILRIPGSVNTRSDRPVTYWLQAGPDQQGYSYTLRNLEDHFGLELEQPIQPRQLLSWGGRKRIAANRSGYLALHAGRLADLEHLWECRKGFRKGHRNFAALIYACTLRGYRTEDGRKLSGDDIRKRVEELAGDCTPPLSLSESAKALQSSEKRYSWADERIIHHLEITPEEQPTLSSIRAGRPPRRRAGPKPAKVKADRHALILKLIEQRFLGARPSLRRMAAELKANGIDVSHVTVGNDYRELGLTGPQLEIEYTSPFLEVVEREKEHRERLAANLRDVLQDGRCVVEGWDDATVQEFAGVALADALEIVTRATLSALDAAPNFMVDINALAAVGSLTAAKGGLSPPLSPAEVAPGGPAGLSPETLRGFAHYLLKTEFAADVEKVARNLAEGRRDGLRVGNVGEMVDHLKSWLEDREKQHQAAENGPVKPDSPSPEG